MIFNLFKINLYLFIVSSFIVEINEFKFDLIIKIMILIIMMTLMAVTATAAATAAAAEVTIRLFYSIL